MKKSPFHPGLGFGDISQYVDLHDRKYLLPEILRAPLTQKFYERWLQRKAATHVRRDRKRGNKLATIEKYKIAIHKAVCESNGKDDYTGERLRWDLISRYDNRLSKQHGRAYKADFCLLPTVDHVGDGKGQPEFKICAWRTNDAKNDLDLKEFVALCRRVIAANPSI